MYPSQPHMNNTIPIPSTTGPMILRHVSTDWSRFYHTLPLSVTRTSSQNVHGKTVVLDGTALLIYGLPECPAPSCYASGKALHVLGMEGGLSVEVSRRAGRCKIIFSRRRREHSVHLLRPKSDFSWEDGPDRGRSLPLRSGNLRGWEVLKVFVIFAHIFEAITSSTSLKSWAFG